MESNSFESSGSPLIGHRLGLVSIVGLWGFYFVVVTLRAAIMSYPGQSSMLLYRVLVIALAIGLTFLLYLFLERFADRPLRWRIPIAFAASLPIATAIAVAISIFSRSLIRWEYSRPMNGRKNAN